MNVPWRWLIGGVLATALGVWVVSLWLPGWLAGRTPQGTQGHLPKAGEWAVDDGHDSPGTCLGHEQARMA